MSPAQELLSLGNVELVGAPSTSWKTKSGLVNWQLGSMGRTGKTHTDTDTDTETHTHMCVEF